MKIVRHRRPAGGKAQSYALVSPQNYTRANVALPPRREAHVSQHEVRRMQVSHIIRGADHIPLDTSFYIQVVI
eukprot:SAG11_NODE_9751_length_883_cov_1.151786_1_plen_72_part_10